MIYGDLQDGGTSRFNCASVENRYQDLVDRNITDGSHVNLEHSDNCDSGG